MGPAGNPARAAVLGHPIAHSLSPTLHQTAYQVLNLDWRYDAIDMVEAGLATFLTGLGSQWRGLSLTMPLKRTVIPLLTHVDPLATRLQSVNTVLLEDGKRTGHNTDVLGLERAVRDAMPRAPARALILGAGATARSALAAMVELGVADVAVSARRSRAESELLILAHDLGLRGRSVGWPPPSVELSDSLVISTVPASAGGWLREAGVPDRPDVLLDVVYDPWPTPVVQRWESVGGVAVGGLAILVHQAAEQVRLMTGLVVNPEILRRAGESVLAQRAIAQAER